VVDDALLELVPLLAADGGNIVSSGVSPQPGSSVAPAFTPGSGASESLRRTEREADPSGDTSALQAASRTSGAGRPAHPARSFMTQSTTDKTLMLCNYCTSGCKHDPRTMMRHLVVCRKASAAALRLTSRYPPCSDGCCVLPCFFDSLCSLSQKKQPSSGRLSTRETLTWLWQARSVGNLRTSPRLLAAPLVSCQRDFRVLVAPPLLVVE
jgi:hypothetical protein